MFCELDAFLKADILTQSRNTGEGKLQKNQARAIVSQKCLLSALACCKRYADVPGLKKLKAPMSPKSSKQRKLLTAALHNLLLCLAYFQPVSPEEGIPALSLH